MKPLSPFQKEPVRTATGQVWAQNCFICNKQIDMLKDPYHVKWLRIDTLIRHRKCYPGMPK